MKVTKMYTFYNNPVGGGKMSPKKGGSVPHFETKSKTQRNSYQNELQHFSLHSSCFYHAQFSYF